MTKREIFEKIVEIMRVDSATCKDKEVGNVEKYQAEIREEMSEKDFVFLVKRFLASFQVPAHLWFGCENLHLTPNYSVRRYEDSLYVTELAAESHLTLGTELVAIDGKSIPELEEEFSEFLGYDEPERQRWDEILKMSEKVTVKTGEGNYEEVDIERNGKELPVEAYEGKALTEHTYYLKFRDFAQEDAIHEFIKLHDEQIRNRENLVIDVRYNEGGSDLSFFPMVQYCYPAGKNWDDEEYKDPTDFGMEINYTKYNVEARVGLLEGALQNLPDEVKDIAQKMIDELKDNCGKGFLKGEDSGIVTSYRGLEVPRKVVILSDYECGSSGDAFVKNMKRSPKVTVMGRNSFGILDYSNESMVHFDRYTFMYPTSRLCALDHGIKMGSVGVPVDVYIPWTPEHIKRDVDLEAALEYLEPSKTEHK